jgi:two-component system sensor histidine kinase DegS
MLFRIVQEALRNIVKHAQASRAEIRVEFNENKTKVTITDNGIGFEVPRDLSDLSRSNKFGLLGMEERVQLLDGSLIAQSELGKGTTIIVEAPVWG